MENKLCYFNKEELLIHMMITFNIDQIYKETNEYKKCLNFETLQSSLNYYNDILAFRNWNKIPLSITIFFDNIKFLINENNTFDNINWMNFSFSKNISNLVDSFENSLNTDSFATILKKMNFEYIDFLTEVRHSCIHKINYDYFVIKKAIEILINNLIRLFFIPLIKDLFNEIDEEIFNKLFKYFNILDTEKYNLILLKYNQNKKEINENSDLFDIKDKLKILVNDVNNDINNKEERFLLYFSKLKFKNKLKKTIYFLLNKINYKKFYKEKYILYTNICSKLVSQLNNNSFKILWENKNINYYFDYILINKIIFNKYYLKLINSLENRINNEYNEEVNFSKINYDEVENFLDSNKCYSINW